MTAYYLCSVSLAFCFEAQQSIGKQLPTVSAVSRST
ncbi:hypothetical protein KP509_30G028800 [Ceratopteris richardii]|uniref:Uncharacterized protein n=1 Tax=Ceratopteris richardii TaxID=49495 RepID=A0A8T2R397_CERRI|nr:hypothetical protein KP509_30G028800 [Ceratopteris richardii]